MNTNRRLVVLAVVTAVILGAMPALLAHPIQPIEAEITSAYNPGAGVGEPDWEYTLTGELSGTGLVYVTDFALVGNTIHWVETLEITTAEGTIVAQSTGVWSFANFKVRVHGTVTGATGAYTELVGASVNQLGYTSSIVPPITGEMTLRIN